MSKKQIVETLFTHYPFSKVQIEQWYEHLISRIGKNNEDVGKALEYCIRQAIATIEDPTETINDLFRSDQFNLGESYGFLSKVVYNDRWYILIGDKDDISFSQGVYPDQHDQWKTLPEYLQLIPSDGVY